MAISESFLVNPDRLNPIIETLIENGEVPKKITEDELKTIGFSNPSDLLVIHILKELKILTPDGTPTELFNKLINPETSELAIAKGIIHGYKDLMDKHEDIHKMKAEDVKEKLANYFKGQKTDLVLKYMANTFTKLVTFAGQDNVEEAYKNFEGATVASKQEEQAEEVATSEVAKEAERTMSGNGSDSDSVETITEVKQEQKGESSIEEVMGVNEPVATSQKEAAQEPEIKEPTENTEVEKKAEPSNDQEPVDELDMEEPESSKKEEENGSNMEKKLASLNSSDKVQQAFVKKADLLYKLERFEELAPTLNAIINKFDGADDKQLKEAVAKSVIRRAKVLAKLKRNDELLPALDEIINRFQESGNEQYYEHASTAMLNKASLLESKGQTEDLLPLYDKITDRLNDSDNEKIKDKVDQIYLKRMELVLEQTDDKNLALNAINGVIERFKDEAEADKYLEEAMFTKASIMEEMGSDEEALEAYSEFIERFGESAIA
ncbi:MAG: DUF5343 domain-containing protein [Balneolaceae bacterium]|nr:DUF5343 domain-containing protein [Balneolaceae bacterium]